MIAVARKEKPARTAKPATPATLILVRRRCLVCDAEQERLEPAATDEIGPICESCGAPTERTAILRAGLVPKNPSAVALGRLGGLKGGRALAESLTPQRRREIARRAAQARWKRPKSSR
jgi:hypothetical protein